MSSVQQSVKRALSRVEGSRGEKVLLQVLQIVRQRLLDQLSRPIGVSDIFLDNLGIQNAGREARNVHSSVVPHIVHTRVVAYVPHDFQGL